MEELFIDDYILPEPLTKMELYELLDKVKQGDEKAIEIIAEHNIKLVIYEVKRRFKTVEYDKGELVSIGNIGLMKAITTFDPSKNTEFSSYATRCIDNEILIFLRKLKKDSNVESLDRIIGSGKDGNELKVEDILIEELDIAEAYTDNETYQIIHQIVEDLPAREREIIMLYFGFNNDKTHTQKEIADMMGISRTYVSKLIAKTLENVAWQLQKKDVIELRDNNMPLEHNSKTNKGGLSMEYKRLITEKEVKKLITEFKEGNKDAGVNLIEHSLKLIDQTIKNDFSRVPYDYDLLFLIGYEGLTAAITNYNESMGSFKNHATVFITQKIKHHIEKNPRPTISIDNKQFISNIIAALGINVSADKMKSLSTSIRYLIEKKLKTAKDIIKLRYGALNKCLSNEEIAQKLGLKIEVVTSVIDKFNEEVRMKAVKIETQKVVEPTKNIPTKKRYIYDYFPKSTKKELVAAISKLSKAHQKLVFKKFGEHLNESNKLNRNEQDILHNVIFVSLENILNGVKMELPKLKQVNQHNEEKRAKNNFFNLFKNSSKDEVLKALGELSSEHQNVIYKRYGQNLDEINKLTEKESNQLYQTIIPNIKKMLAGETMKKVSRKSKSLQDYFNTTSLEELKEAIQKLSPSYQSIIYKRYGQNLDEINKLNEKERNQLYQTIIPNIRKILAGETFKKTGRKSKALLDYFEGISLEEIKEAIQRLKPTYQSIIYKRYGQNLNEINELNKNEKEKLYRLIIPNIRKILAGETLKEVGRKSKALSDYFKESSLDELKGAIQRLNPRYQCIIYKRYGQNLDEINKLAEKESRQLQQTIIPNIKKLLAGEPLKEVSPKSKTLSDYFEGISLEELKEAIQNLSPSYQSIIYKKYGQNLDEINGLNTKEKEQLHNTIIPDIRKILSQKNTKPIIKENKSLYIILNEDKKLIDEIILGLSSEEKEALYQRFGYDFDNPKSILLSPETIDYVDNIIIPKIKLIATKIKNNSALKVGADEIKSALDTIAKLNAMHLLTEFNMIDLIIFTLRVGLTESGAFELEKIATFFNKTPEEINDITRKIMLKYQENFNQIYDIILENLHIEIKEGKVYKLTQVSD